MSHYTELLKSDNGWPRRIRTDLYHAAETAIKQAISVCELTLPADPLETDAVILLEKAQEKVADLVDREIREQKMLMPRQPPGGVQPEEFKCPLCDGAGFTSRHVGVPSLSWEMAECRACNGRGVLWRLAPPPTTPNHASFALCGTADEPLVPLDGADWYYDPLNDVVRIGHASHQRLKWIAAFERIGRHAGISKDTPAASARKMELVQRLAKIRARVVAFGTGHDDDCAGDAGCTCGAVLSRTILTLCEGSEAIGDSTAQADLERKAAAYDRINTPELIDFVTAVQNEALHQRERWAEDGDSGKTPADWFWLIGYLAGKALHNPPKDGATATEAQLHRIVTVAAAAANWHAATLGAYVAMRPGTAL